MRDHHLDSDPIIATDLVAFSHSCSRLGSPSELVPSQSVNDGEREPLLAVSSKKPFYRPRPLWLVPFAVTAALARGMTIAPRVEVFTHLSCNAMHYNHTSSASSLPIPTTPDSHTHYTPIYFSLDPSGPSLSPSYFRPSGDSNFTSITIHRDGDEEEEDPRRIPSHQCISDPAVQAGAARMQTVMAVTAGAFTALTTGWWGHFGERHGRTKVLAISTLGLFLTDLTFILVSTPHSPFSAHGHKLLVLAPLVEGLLGGWSTLQGANYAYISDCTSSGSRARIFSSFTGVFYVGFALGPTVGAALIQQSGGSGRAQGPETVTSVFWVAICCAFVNLMLLLFVFPESLSAEKQLKARNDSGNGKTRTASTSAHDQGSNDHNDSESPENTSGIVMTFLRPLGIFLPTTVQFEVPGKGVQTKQDWSLTWLALALLGYMLSTGLFQMKYLYAEHVYEWSAQQLSYYISLLGGMKALHLLFLMPVIIAIFKHKPAHSAPNAKPKPTKAHLAREIKFDLSLVRFSLVVDLLSHTLVVMSPVPSYNMRPTDTSVARSQTLFVLFSTLNSLGSGIVPAIQSLALCILHMRALSRADVSSNNVDEQTQKREVVADVEVGKLFGALAVLQAVGQMILGPMLYGLIYSGTVATLPKAIFMATAGILLCSLSFVFLVRPGLGQKGDRSTGIGVGGSGKRAKVRQEEERGRSRVSKDLRKGIWASGLETEAT